VWHGRQGPSQIHDVPSETPARFHVAVWSRRIADGMTRVNARVSVPRAFEWPGASGWTCRFQGAICHLEQPAHYVAYCPGVGVVRFDDDVVARPEFQDFAENPKNQGDIALVVFSRHRTEAVVPTDAANLT
ncbi:unnamed protein product, partial [Prorocentrum cordatum]